jgi:hypothetical protein
VEALVLNRIVCAALRHQDTGDLILGPRHFDATMHKQISQYKLIYQDWKKAEQGFIDTHGNFLTREEAKEVAEKQNQILRRVGRDGPSLYSENLY